ncbi:hypothetical protein LTR94_034965, partial [Friedmanniomyces endolithicus]
HSGQSAQRGRNPGPAGGGRPEPAAARGVAGRRGPDRPGAVAGPAHRRQISGHAEGPQGRHPGRRRFGRRGRRCGAHGGRRRWRLGLHRRPQGRRRQAEGRQASGRRRPAGRQPVGAVRRGGRAP